MITAVMLNWKRPANVRRIVAGWAADPLISQGIVWNNNPAAPLGALEGAVVINPSHDLGLNNRFVAGAMARTDCVLLQDDDLELPAASLAKLYWYWQEDPGVLHGLFGRRPAADGAYSPRPRPTGQAPIVLTRALLVSRELILQTLRVLPEFDAVQAAGRPVGNGEDIILSYVARAHSGRLNRTHPLPVVELPDQHAICRQPGHLPHRTRVVRACEAWLAERTPAPREEVW